MTHRRPSELRRISSLRMPSIRGKLLSRRSSLGPSKRGADCESLVLEALKSDSQPSRFRTTSLLVQAAEALEKASILYTNGNEKQAYDVLYCLGDGSISGSKQAPSAPVFFAAEKARLQNQRQVQREKERILELSRQEHQIKQSMRHIDEERMDFGETLQLALIQRDDAKMAVEKHTLDVDKLNQTIALMQAKFEANPAIPFVGLENMVSNDQEVHKKAKLLEVDLQRKEDTVRNIQNELSDLHDRLRSLQMTLELVQTSVSDIRLVLIELQQTTKDVEAFVMQSAKSLFKELYVGKD